MKCRIQQSLTFAVAFLAMAVSCYAQTWSAENVILPGPDSASAPTGAGGAVMMDPLNAGPAPGVLIGINSYNAETASILRLTPTDSSSSSFTSENLDNALTFARGLAYNTSDAAIYAAGYAPVDPKAKNITYIWKVRRSA